MVVKVANGRIVPAVLLLQYACGGLAAIRSASPFLPSADEHRLGGTVVRGDRPEKMRTVRPEVLHPRLHWGREILRVVAEVRLVLSGGKARVRIRCALCFFGRSGLGSGAGPRGFRRENQI